MSESKFTPGPWVYSGSDNGVPLLRIACGDGDHPAYEGRCYEVKEANSKLIAAAPELLEALELIERKYAAIADYAGLPVDKDAVSKARAAIEKATA